LAWIRLTQESQTKYRTAFATWGFACRAQKPECVWV
jgi:hypothetical protein